MKKAFVLTLVLTLIFPAYCFASPTKDKSPIDENMVTEVMWALEDGVIDQEEMGKIIEIAQFENACEYSKGLVLSGLVGAIAGILFGGSWNPSVTYMMTFMILNAYIICTVYSDMPEGE